MNTVFPLSAKQGKFVQEYLVDGNGSQAALRAGYSASGAPVAASRLLRNAKVAAAIKMRQEADAERLQISREKVAAQLMEAFEMGRSRGEPAAMISACRELARMFGYFEPVQARVRLSTVSGDDYRSLEFMSDAELLALISRGG